MRREESNVFKAKRTVLGLLACILLLNISVACGEQGGATVNPPPAIQQDVPDLQAVIPSSESRGAQPATECQVDADCVVKNVGNCCGYFPKCVNKNAEVDPEKVRRECEAQGRSSVCGFTEIQACTCQQNHCQAVQARGSFPLQ